MRKVPPLSGIILLALLTGSVSFAQDHAKPMTNDDVVAMVKAGLPEDIIINAIHAQDTNFDNTASGLLELNKQGVSYKIMEAMLAASTRKRDAATTAPATLPAAANGYANSPAESATAPQRQPAQAQPAAASNQRPGAPAAAGRPPSNTAAPAAGAGIFDKIGQVQSQVNGAIQQVQGTVQQAQQAVQQTEGSLQQLQGTVQQAEGSVQQAGGAVPSQQGKQSPTRGQAAPATTTVPGNSNSATAQAKALQGQPAAVAAPKTPAQQQRQQQADEAQKKAQKSVACMQQATQDHPEGGPDAANQYLACVQAQ